MPAAVAIPLIAAAASSTAAIVGAKLSSNASNNAAKLNAAASDKATALAQEQEAERRREYDQQQAELKRQWDVTESNKAPYRQVSADALFRVRDLLGLPQGAPGGGAGGASSGGPVGNVPPAPKSVADAIAQANQLAYGGTAKHTDQNYWTALYAKDPEYAWKRMLGWQAGPSDAATTGPYAGSKTAGPSAKTNPLTGAPMNAPMGVATDPNYAPIIPFRALMGGR